MAKAANKMRPTDTDPQEFIARVENATRRKDAERMIEIMREISGEEPVMWGASIIGFGSYHYRYESGREGDAPILAFSPRKANLVVYLVADYEQRYPEQLAKLGPYKSGKTCLYLTRLDRVDEDVLRYLIKDSYELTRAEYA
ncbi:DUF1801 domain-containing protein [uncultured Georgenia sp.]|uniref:DUF1801 domain-containing protein n=1 Tax=uncultured Georgenia sp. TaxID=378209 RepID=UPI002628349E|nr:DUF1801 domain-containing protein [uncultured Georgenia sp.]